MKFANKGCVVEAYCIVRKLASPRLIIMVSFLLMLSCDKNRTNLDTNNRVIVKDFLVNFYDKPIASVMNKLDDSLMNDSLFFNLLMAEDVFQEFQSKNNYLFDSVLLTASNLGWLPEYQPSNSHHRANYNEGEFDLLATKWLGSYGVYKVDLIYIENSELSSILSKRSFSIDEKCMPIIGSKTWTVDCFEEVSFDELKLTKANIDSIKEWYQEFDIGRISIYDHQGKILCHDYSYKIRFLNRDKDKVTSVDCPGRLNAIYQFYRMINEIQK